MKINKKAGHFNAIWLTFVTISFLFVGLLILDLYRYAITARRAFNYAQAAAQSVASGLSFTDSIPSNNSTTLPNPNNKAYLTPERGLELCRQMHSWISESIARTSWEYPFYYHDPSSLHVQCGVTDRDVFEVIVVLRFEPLYFPLFPNVDAFGYSRVRLHSGIENPF